MYCCSYLQVGCQMGCTFCATGTMGLEANLSSGEILEQLVHGMIHEPISNVVFMGMGEPLHNYDAVLEAAKAMIHPKKFGLARTRVTVSTVGIVKRMKQITNVR